MKIFLVFPIVSAGSGRWGEISVGGDIVFLLLDLIYLSISTRGKGIGDKMVNNISVS